MTTPAQTAWRRRLDLEHPNLRAAADTLTQSGDIALLLRLTHALSFSWFTNTHGAEGLQHHRHVLAHETGQTVSRARALVDAGMLAYSAGAYTDAIQWFEEALPILQDHHETETLAVAWLLRGTVAEHLGDEDTAEACYQSGLTIARECNHVWVTGEILPNLSDAAYRRGDLTSAEQYALEAHGVLHTSGNAYMECMNLGNLGQVALARGDHVRAAALFAEGLDLAEEISSHWNLANLIGCAAAVAVALGDMHQAAHLLGAGDAVLEVSGHPRMPHFVLSAQTTARVRTTLGADALRVEWDLGRTMPTAAAMQAARAVFAAARTA